MFLDLENEKFVGHVVPYVIHIILDQIKSNQRSLVFISNYSAFRNLSYIKLVLPFTGYNNHTIISCL